MAYKAAIFDLDGTLLNTLDDLHGSVNHTLEEYGFAPMVQAHEAIFRRLAQGRHS